jgi:hypothetical protein
MAKLLLATAVLFVAGVAVERRDEQQGERTEQVETAEHREGSEAEHRDEAPAHRDAAERSDTRVLGIDAEATPLVVFTVLVSIAFAVLLWRSDSRVLLAIVAIVAAVIATFDVAEVVHQMDESRTALAITAALVGAGHAAIAILGTTALRHDRPTNVVKAP